MNIIESNLPDGLVHAHAARPTRIRYVILIFILVATIVGCVDRISRIATVHEQRLTLDKAQMGQIFAAFGQTYAFAPVPGGYVADLFGSRLTYRGLVSWSRDMLQDQ